MLDTYPEAASIDPREVAHYQALAETWWDRSGPFWPLHRLNELRVEWIRLQAAHHFRRDPGAQQPLAGLQVLDIGCGGGILSESLARLGARVTGIDVVERNIAIARHHAAGQDLDVHYRLTSAEQLATQGESFDAVFNMEVVEHVADLPGFMAACNALVRPGGQQFVATINRNPLSWLVAIVGAEYVLGWLPKGTHQWGRFLRPGELETLLEVGGLEITARTGVRVNPFNRTLSLTSFEGINYMVAAVR